MDVYLCPLDVFQPQMGQIEYSPPSTHHRRADLHRVQLGSWARTQKTARKGKNNHLLTPKRVAELDAFGFVGLWHLKSSGTSCLIGSGNSDNNMGIAMFPRASRVMVIMILTREAGIFNRDEIQQIRCF
eukprot:scaffold103051_cov30-Attheya_sp.AAC.1